MGKRSYGGTGKHKYLEMRAPMVAKGIIKDQVLWALTRHGTMSNRNLAEQTVVYVVRELEKWGYVIAEEAATERATPTSRRRAKKPDACFLLSTQPKRCQMRSHEQIKTDFLAKIDADEAFEGLTNAVIELERDHNMSKHEACMMVTRWAVDAGYFSEDDAEEAEAEAEELVQDGR